MKTLFRIASTVVLLLPVCVSAQVLTGDTYIFSSNPSANFGTQQSMFTGSSSTSTALMEFSLSNLPAGLTSGNITKAVLLVYVKSVTAAGNVAVAPLSGPFTETTVNYTNGISLVGSPFSGNIALGAAQVGTFIPVDVTAQVQSAIGGGSVGFAIVPQDSTVVAQFDTKESTSTSHAPDLQIFLQSSVVLGMSNALPGGTPDSIFIARSAGSNPGSSLIVQSGSPAAGATDIAGGDAILAGGPGTGLGGGGNLRMQTSGQNDLSGTLDNLLVDREIFVARGKQLTLSAPGFTSLMSIHLVGTHTAGGRVFYMVRATDGGSQIATEEGVIQYLATANSITCTVQTNDKLHLGTVNSGCTPGFFNPASQPGISIFDNVTFSSPAPIVVHEIYFRITNDSGSSIRLEP
jgi:hypothetical protein